MAWRIELSNTARKQLAKMDKIVAKRVTEYLRKRIAPLDNPRQAGKPLSGPMGDFWRYRVGDYRIICEIQDTRLTVLVVEVGSRQDIYH